MKSAGWPTPRDHVPARDPTGELDRAVARHEFVMHYQPQVELDTGRLIGCEALLRWEHPDRGLLYPAEFIDALDQAECSAEIGWWTLGDVCRQLAAWDRDGLHVPCVGVNLFAKQLRSPDFAARVLATLGQHGLAPDRLELELTEALALPKGDPCLAPLEALREAGVRVALDDFGTGFASLSTLKHVPVSRLKIDRSFVADLEAGSHDAAVVRAVVGIAGDLHVGVIAEGIETASQAERVRQMGCHEGQGFLYGRGLLAAEFARRFHPRPA